MVLSRLRSCAQGRCVSLPPCIALWRLQVGTISDAQAHMLECICKDLQWRYERVPVYATGTEDAMSSHDDA